MGRYFVRWRTEYGGNGFPKLLGWDVCDSKKFDKIEIAEFAPDEEDKAEGLCKLLNSIEEEADGIPK